MIKRYFTVGLLVTLGGCSDATDPEPVTTAAVSVIDNRFDPGANRVNPNETVTWTWNGNNQPQRDLRRLVDRQFRHANEWDFLKIVRDRRRIHVLLHHPRSHRHVWGRSGRS